MTSSIWFNTLWVVAILTALSRLVVLRRRRESPARILVHGQPVVFTTRAVVQFYVRGTWGHGWGGLNERGRQELLVHSGGLEVTPGAFDGSVSINTMLLEGAIMCRDRLGAWPRLGGNSCWEWAVWPQRHQRPTDSQSHRNEPLLREWLR